VTGAAKGIGYGIARRFEREDYRVSVWDIDLAPLEESRLLAQQIQVDVTDPDSIELAVERTLSAFERIDILVNNAGVSGPTLPAWEYPIDAWDRVLAVDLTGVFLCCRAVIPHMRERGAGRIVNVASIVGKEGNALAPAYSAAKAGVIGLTKSLAKDLVDVGVLVNCVAPAMAQTALLDEMTDDYISMVKAKIPMGRLCTVGEIADMVAWVAGPECTFCTGAVFDLSGGRATY
jgi:3-oxoacyl-[acyl-carrier protein] reductase